MTAAGPNGSEPQRPDKTKRWLELLLWLRTAVNVLDLVMRTAPHAAENATANLALMTARLAAWLLRTITRFLG
ncbi:hypothetical protein AB0C34_29465 [Nocardia sp. NPDC049220]|uniref:hypothetical protein n=1 Tax=Nocardia sp. NPDC049220 TaxID=3155273 RepID=UPI0033EE154A